MAVELLSAMAYDLSTFEDDGYPDPVLKVPGELPARARSFGINRVYQGAQGRYEESIIILDPSDTVIWQREYKFIELRGEMFEDLFVSKFGTVVQVADPREHKIVFLINGKEIGRVPLFIEAAESAQALGVVGDAAEVALKKGSITWLSIPQPSGETITRPAWYVQQGRKLFVIKGPGEQELPHLEDNTSVVVTVKSKEIKATLGTLHADVRVVANDSDEFDKIATLGMGNRLNLKDGEAAAQRWKDTCTMVELSLNG